MSEGITDEGRYRLLVDAITDYAIYMLDPDGVVTSWNPGAERFKGYKTDEILGRNFSTFYTPEDRLAKAPESALRTAREVGRFEKEGWRVRKDGTRFWAHVVIDPIRDRQGELLGFAKITRDLTERRLAENALRQSEQQFRLLVQGVTDYAIYMLDCDGRVVSWNAGAERIKGYDASEIIGQHVSQFYSEDDRQIGLPTRGLTTARAEGRSESEGWRIRKDGSRFWAHVIIDAIRDDAGQVIGFAKITRDITERREAQQALERAQQALFQSQKLESIGQLTGGIAHDFNNLLMAITGSLELMRKRLPDDPRLLALLENAMMGANRGAALTQRMLAFARRQELRREIVALPALVEGMRGLLERSIGPGIRIEVDFTEPLPPVESDANQLESALMNLVVNGRDAMPGGGVITIAAEPVQIGPDHPTNLPPGDYVRFSIGDTGQGMDAATQARATEPFFTTKGVGKGTGLGLSMVHGLTEQSGGRLTLESAPGQGTTISLWLPVAGDEAVKIESPAPKAARVSVPRTRRLVLAVDDDGLVLMNTAAMLEDLGHTVIIAVSGVEALALIERYPAIDLVITDQAMPGMTGLELADALAACRPNLPVILATGYAELPARTGSSRNRLAKPFTQAELADAVDPVLTPATQPEPVDG